MPLQARLKLKFRSSAVYSPVRAMANLEARYLYIWQGKGVYTMAGQGPQAISSTLHPRNFAFQSTKQQPVLFKLGGPSEVSAGIRTSRKDKPGQGTIEHSIASMGCSERIFALTAPSLATVAANSEPGKLPFHLSVLDRKSVV